VRHTEKLVREARTGQSTATQPAMQTSSNNDEESLLNRKPDPNEAYLLNKLQESLKTKVILKRSTPGSGRIEIEFYSPEDLERIVEILVPFA
jgi:ParB family chromosome partitioning protein